MNRFSPVTATKTRPIMGVVIAMLVPLVTAGILIGVLHKPQEQLGQVTAAIVNNDEPVELDGQIVPLGRQLAGGLVASGESDASANSNDNANDTADAAEMSGYRWEITDAQKAAAGLDDGKYGAMVVIPENFSAAATSSAGDIADIERATISVTTSPHARLIDDAITRAIATVATQTLGSELTQSYLDNVFIGFNTLHSQLGDAADGAGDIAAGSGELAGGIGELSTGVEDLGGGADQLAGGASELATGLGEFHDGIRHLGVGSQDLAGGAGELATGASDLADGLGELHGGLAELVDGSAELSTGLDELATGTGNLPAQLSPLSEGIGELAGGASELSAGLEEQGAGISQLRDLACSPLVQDPTGQLCAGLNELAEASSHFVDGAEGLAEGAGAISEGVDEMTGSDGPLAELSGGVRALADGSNELTAGITQLRDGAGQTVDGAHSLADGAGALSGGATDLSDGIVALEGGSSDIGLGASALATGSQELADGVGEMETGVGELASGSEELHDGTQALAEGLDEAVSEIPTYPDGQREKAVDVIADPVTLAAASDSLFDLNLTSNWIGLFTIVALWISALWIYTGIPTTVPNFRATTRSSAWVSLRSLALPAAAAVGQGLIVTLLIAIFGDLSGGKLLGFALLASLIALTFLLVQRAVLAVLGRWGLVIALGVAILAIATTLTSAMPAIATAAARWLPIGPAADSLNGLENGLGITAAVVALVAWALGGWIVIALDIRKRRGMVTS